jgi:hypothetical protein
LEQDLKTRSGKARTVIEAGERVEDLVALWNVGRTMLFWALAGQCNELLLNCVEDCNRAAPW